MITIRYMVNFKYAKFIFLDYIFEIIKVIISETQILSSHRGKYRIISSKANQFFIILKKIDNYIYWRQYLIISKVL